MVQPERSVAYNPQGDLTLVKQDAETTVYTHNADGQIETINSSRGTTRLTYFPDGKVKSIQFADGSVHEYEHNALGFREATHRSDGTRMYYGYDASGNLIHSEGSSADGKVAGQVLDVDENARIVGIHYANGDDTAITYDAEGNPQTLDNGGESPFEYIYDGTNRLAAVRQGDRITGSHVYTPTEPDLRLQLDNRTMRVGANALRQSTSIGDVLSVLYARPYGSTAGVVRFDQLTRSFDLPSEFGIVLPDAVAANSLVRRKLVDVDDGDVRRRVDFDRPSNVMFVPPEYATINCGIGCTFTGITLRANGSTGPISVVEGNTVSLLASKNTGSGCPLLLCEFSANGVPIPSNGLNSTSYAFFGAGTYIVAAGCECSGCDLFGDDTVTVAVATCGASSNLTSQTVATTPANTARTTVGVGEQVVLTLTPVPACPVDWQVSGGGTLSEKSNSSAKLTAHDRASTPTVTASFGSTSRSKQFNVVEPSGVIIEPENTNVFHLNGIPSVGFRGRAYITPADVSFENIEVQEGAVNAVATGYLAYQNGLPHAQGPWLPIGAVVIGKGSRDDAHDDISGAADGHLPYASGTFTWAIPWSFRVGGGAPKVFKIVPQVKTIDASATMTISKGGTTKSAALNDPDSGF